MNTSKRYFVTGGTGLVGNNVVRQLTDQGVFVRVLVRTAQLPEALAGLDVELFEGDIRNAAEMQQAVEGCTHVVHAAGDTHIGWHHWDRAREINVNGTRNVAQAALAQAAKLIYVSTVDMLPASVDGRPVSESDAPASKLECTYVVTKREAEAVVTSFVNEGLEAVIVHPGFMLGPYDWKPSSGKMLLAVAKGMLAAPVGGMSGCDVRDVAQAILAAADSDIKQGERFILAGENMSYRKAWQLMAEITGGRAPKLPIGPLVRWVVGGGADLYSKLSGREGDVNSAMLKMSKMLHYYDSSKAKQQLGYQVRPFRETIEAAWNWFQNNPRSA